MGAFPTREHRARGQAWGGTRVTHGKPEGQEIKIKGTEEAYMHLLSERGPSEQAPHGTRATQ